MVNTARAKAKLAKRAWRLDRRRNKRGEKNYEKKQEKKRVQRVHHSEPTGRQFAVFLTLLVLTATCFFVVSYIAGLARVSLLTDR